MILIDSVLVDEELLNKPFLCDTARCKGACCTVKGGSGAPVLDTEEEAILSSLEVASGYLSAESLQEIQTHGALEGPTGDRATRCIDDSDCVFVFYDNNIARCALEKAFFDGKSTFRKPLSCHLFPLRVADFGGDYLHYEVIDECRPALENGEQKSVYMYQMLEDALVRLYGKEWYEQLKGAAAANGSNKHMA